MPMITDDDTDAQAFNNGSDARLAGRSQRDNPYDPRDLYVWRAWRMGWSDMANHWGKAARRRRVRPLPAVEQGDP